MADTELETVKFNVPVEIELEAKDIVEQLGAEVHDLIVELDDEADSWQLTVLLARHFSRQAELAPPAVLAATDEELHAGIEDL